MNNILLIAKNILRLLFRKKNSIIIYVLLPIVGVLVPLLLFASGQGTFVRIGVASLDSGFLPDGIYQDLAQQERFKVSTVAIDTINESISGGKLDCALIIPEGFTNSYLSGAPMTIDIVSVEGISATGWLEGYLNTSLPNIDTLARISDGDASTFKALYEDYTSSEIPVFLKDVKDKQTGFQITYIGLGFLIQFILLGAQRTMSLIIKERKERTLARIHCAPVNGFEFISGNIIVNVSLVTLQTMATLIILHSVLKGDMGTDPFTMMVIFFPLLIAAVGASLMMVSFAKNENHLNIMTTMFIYPTCLISGCFWDVEIMPFFMQKLARLFPQRWALEAIETLMAGGILKDVSMNLIVMSSFAIAFFAVAIYGFSRKNAVLA